MKTKDLTVKKNQGKPNGSVKLSISNELTIYNIKNIKKEIEELSETYTSIDLSFNNLQNIDLSGVQFIYALKKETLNSGKEISISFDLNEELTNLISNCGFSEIIKN